MDIFRPATADDAAQILDFTQAAEPGLTTVPRTPERVHDYVTESRRFLNGEVDANRVLFVAERAGAVIGISGIIPTLGIERPFYSFKRSRHARRATGIDLQVKYDTLQLTTDFDDYTELASIFIAPSARRTGVGRLLSLGRLAFIEAHRARFKNRLMADIRGWVDDQGRSPMWDHLTSKFIQTDFSVADRLSASDGRFIAELLPSLPILLNLLPDSVNESAGKPHDLSAGAMRLLTGAGFEETDLCDIFDGGPAIECRADRTLIARTVFTPDIFRASKSGDLGIHFIGELSDFRATLGPIDLRQRMGHPDIARELGKGVRIALAQDRRLQEQRIQDSRLKESAS